MTSPAFTSTVFNALRARFESDTTWRYSGEVDLLLANAVFNSSSQQAELDFATAIVLDIDAMLRDEAITSFGRLFEEICRYAEVAGSSASTENMSDLKGLCVAGKSILDWIVDVLPQGAGYLWKRGRHFRTVTIAKR